MRKQAQLNLVHSTSKIFLNKLNNYPICYKHNIIYLQPTNHFLSPFSTKIRKMGTVAAQNKHE